jgi:hypothetical protein
MLISDIEIQMTNVSHHRLRGHIDIFIRLPGDDGKRKVSTPADNENLRSNQ